MWMLTDMSEASGRDALLAGLHREYSPDVPAHRHQIPFAFDVLETSQQALSIAHHRFDDAEHRFGRLFTQPVQPFTPRGLQPIRHLLQRRRGLRRGFRSGGKALLPAEMMGRAPHRDQRLDSCRLAGLNIRLAEVSVVSEYSLGPTQL